MHGRPVCNFELDEAHQSGFAFLIRGSVSVSQNMVVAVKAVDAVEVRIDMMANVLVSSAVRSAVS